MSEEQFHKILYYEVVRYISSLLCLRLTLVVRAREGRKEARKKRGRKRRRKGEKKGEKNGESEKGTVLLHKTCVSKAYLTGELFIQRVSMDISGVLVNM